MNLEPKIFEKTSNTHELGKIMMVDGVDRTNDII